MTKNSIASLILGLLVPGLGHIYLKKHIKGVIFFSCILGMTLLGLFMGGKIYSFQTKNPLTILAFFSDIGNGLLYIISRFTSIGIGELHKTTYEFGTTYIAGAGLLNYLVALDAFDIARGKKE